MILLATTENLCAVVETLQIGQIFLNKDNNVPEDKLLTGMYIQLLMEFLLPPPLLEFYFIP